MKEFGAVVTSFCVIALCALLILMMHEAKEFKVELNTLRSRVSHNEHRIEELRMEHGLLLTEEVR